MENTTNISEMLDLIPQPAFCVQDGRITRLNAAARSRTLNEQTYINDLLATGKEEYSAFSGTWLYLSLHIAGLTCGASVTRMEGCDLFVLDEDQADELQALALASQELRLPLSGLLSISSRLSRYAKDTGDPSLQDLSARLSRGLFRLLRPISNMSDAYRYTQDPTLKSESRDVCSFLREHLDGCAQALQTCGTPLNYQLPQERIFCLLDTEKLERALHNILLNAVKFSVPGSPIDVKLAQRKNTLYLTVQSHNDLALSGDIFSRYRRGPGIEDGRMGIGLGLVLVRAAATAHGGTVLVEQLPEDLVRLTMTIPIRKRADTTVHSPKLSVDYAGGWDHRLLELSEVLPVELYRPECNE